VSDSRAANIRSINTKKSIFLSGTIEDDVRKVIKSLYCDSCTAHWWTISTSDAINLGILPCPKIYMVDCSLDNTERNLVYVKTKGGKKAEGLTPQIVEYKDMWTFLKANSGKPYVAHISCTQKEYYEILSNEIDYLKKVYFAMRQPFAKNRWLHKAGERKIFIGNCKTAKVKEILDLYKDKRTICFATNIAQCEELGTAETIIHSKNDNDGDDMINDFNSEKINKLYAVKMFREGVNLQSIDAGFMIQVDNGSVSSSQVLGRVLRSEAPELYIFRMRGTVDEGYVETALERIDSKFIYDYRFRTQLVTG
jgi:superfamily II DNA or RNA helicase